MRKRSTRKRLSTIPADLRGSTLLLTLLLVGVLAISVAAMLSSVRYMTRSADDKIAEEECYFAAMAGLNTVKAFIMQPSQARAMAGDAVGSAFDGLTSGAKDFSSIVISKSSDLGFLTGLTADEICGNFYTGPMGSYCANKSITDDTAGRRYLIYNWGGPGVAQKPMVIRRGDANYGTPSDPLFNATLAGSGGPESIARSWVDQVRITTPYRGAGSPPADSVKQTTLIIEVVAKTAGAGLEKTRVLTGRVLVIPENSGLHPAQSGSAIVSGAALTINGNSPFNVHWGGVMAKNNLSMLGVKYDKGNAKMTFDTTTGNARYTGVGTKDPYDNTEKWLRFMAGVSGQLVDKQGNPIFADGGGTATPGAPISDFVAQLRSSPSPFTGWSVNSFTFENLSPSYATDATKDLYFGTAGEGESWTGERGAFVQGQAWVDDEVNRSFDSLDYKTWKNFAIQTKGYLRPTSDGYYVNATGQKLYVNAQKTLTTVSSGNTALTNLGQISMKNLIPSNGDTSLIPDRMLFVDSKEGTENGTKVDLKINASDDFFWKGMVFVNGNVVFNGTGQTPTVLGKTPDEWKSGAAGHPITPCIMDGILRITGTCTNTGNPKVYGSVVAGQKNGSGAFDAGGTPEIFYNQRCKDGIFKPVNTPLLPAVVSGPVVEVASLHPTSG